MLGSSGPTPRRSNLPSPNVMRKAGLRHVDTREHEEDGQVWQIVRYERGRDA